MADKKEKKGFAKEFKEFISRGSIVDMAVGVVIGGAFTAIVNALVSSVLTPLINFVVFKIFGAGENGGFSRLDVVLADAVTKTAEDGTEVVVSEAIVLKFSDLITAIINFLLIALTLFLIIRTINRIRAEADALKEKAKKEAEEEKAEAEKKAQ